MAFIDLIVFWIWWLSEVGMVSSYESLNACDSLLGLLVCARCVWMKHDSTVNYHCSQGNVRSGIYCPWYILCIALYCTGKTKTTQRLSFFSSEICFYFLFYCFLRELLMNCSQMSANSSSNISLMGGKNQIKCVTIVL